MVSGDTALRENHPSSLLKPRPTIHGEPSPPGGGETAEDLPWPITAGDSYNDPNRLLGIISDLGRASCSLETEDLMFP